ncbi:hypothetical protein [Frankia sp. CiP3]|uniref:hypothetical protein n=1 Tax=Frankia sp. CiP3 TaxID=2880971 RepID=UPI001EF4D509|nr:hypothetical protein [Frankia sp. CiP3]
MTGIVSRVARDGTATAGQVRSVNANEPEDHGAAGWSTRAGRFANRWREWADVPRQFGIAMVIVVIFFGGAAGTTALIFVHRHHALRVAGERAGASVIKSQNLRVDLSNADADAAALVFDEVDLDLDLDLDRNKDQLARDAYDATRTENTVTDKVVDAEMALAELRRLNTSLCPDHGTNPTDLADSSCEGDLLDLLERQIPTYTDLVATARAHNRVGNQVAQAYLQHASALMQNKILPAVDQLFVLTSEDLDRESRRATDATHEVEIAVLLGTCCCTALGGQVLLFRRTQRVFDVRLLAGTGVLLLAGGLMFAGMGIERSRVVTAQEKGYQPMVLFTQARVLVLQTRTDDNLSLISLSDRARYDQGSQDAVRALGYDLDGKQFATGSLPAGRRGALVAALDHIPAPERSALTADLDAWLSTRAVVTALLAPVGVAEKPAGGDEKLSRFAHATLLTVNSREPAFARLDQELDKVLNVRQADFRARMSASAPPLDWLGWSGFAGVLVAALFILAGFRRRLREYAA